MIEEKIKNLLNVFRIGFYSKITIIRNWETLNLNINTKYLDTLVMGCSVVGILKWIVGQSCRRSDWTQSKVDADKFQSGQTRGKQLQCKFRVKYSSQKLGKGD